MPDYTLDEWGIPYPVPGDLIASNTENLRLAIESLAGKTGQGLTNAVGQANAYADAAAKNVDWRAGTLPNGADLNTYTEDADAGLWSVFSTFTYLNNPLTGAGSLLVEPSNSGVRQRIAAANGSVVLERDGFKAAGGTTWTAWSYARSSSYPSGVPLDDMRTHGDFIINSDVLAGNIPDWPTELTSPRASEVKVRRTSTGLTRQTITPVYRDNVTLTRVTTAISPVPFPFGPWTVVGSESGVSESAPVGLTNDLLRQDFSRRRGGRIKTNGLGAVSIRCDHGLTNFRDKVLPLCEAAGIVPSLAINSRNWGYTENAGVDAAAVNGWVAAGKIEVWNHSATHTNPDNPLRLTEEIVTGLAELRAQLPDAEIDGWAVPGVGASDPYMGMGSIANVQSLYESEAGRMILSHHAVTTGYIPNTAHRVLDGEIRQGMGHYTMETKTATEIIAEIDAAIDGKTGLQLMIHPSLIDTTGYITSEQLGEVITHIASRVAANEIVALSPYDMMVADAL